MVMLGGHQSVVEFTAAGTLYGDPFRPNAASRIAAQARVTEVGDAETVTVTLQGGWTDSDPATEDDWVDTPFSAAPTSGVRVPLDDGADPAGTIAFTEWPMYRYKVVADAACTVEIRTTEVD